MHRTERSPKRWLLLISLVQSNSTLPEEVSLFRQTSTNKKKVVKEGAKEGRTKLLKSCWSRVFCISFGKLNLEARNSVIDTERLLIAGVWGLPWLSAQSTSWLGMHVCWACIQVRSGLTCTSFARGSLELRSSVSERKEKDKRDDVVSEKYNYRVWDRETKKKNGATLKRDKWTERDHEIRYHRDKWDKYTVAAIGVGRGSEAERRTEEDR